jgi:hypothetical protein
MSLCGVMGTLVKYHLRGKQSRELMAERFFKYSELDYYGKSRKSSSGHSFCFYHKFNVALPRGLE